MPLRDRSLPHQIVIYFYRQRSVTYIAVSCNCRLRRAGRIKNLEPFAFDGILTAARALAVYDEHLSSLPPQEEDQDGSVASLE